LFNHNHLPLHHPNKPYSKPEKAIQKKGNLSNVDHIAISNEISKTTEYHIGAIGRYTEVQNLINANQL